MEIKEHIFIEKTSNKNTFYLRNCDFKSYTSPNDLPYMEADVMIYLSAIILRQDI